MPPSQDFAVAANSRFNVPIVTSEAAPSTTYMRVPRGTRFSAVVESLGATPIVVERAMYWNVVGQFWARGLGRAGDQAAVAAALGPAARSGLRPFAALARAALDAAAC